MSIIKAIGFGLGMGSNSLVLSEVVEVLGVEISQLFSDFITFIILFIFQNKFFKKQLM